MSEPEEEDSRQASAPGKAPASKVPEQWRRNYRRLIRLRKALGKEPDAETARSPCYGARRANGDETMDRVLALTLFSSEQEAIAEIEAALGRIQLGTYGVCERSGVPILPSRLDLIPWARFTAEVQTQAEKDAADSQARSTAAARKPRPRRE